MKSCSRALRTNRPLGIVEFDNEVNFIHQAIEHLSASCSFLLFNTLQSTVAQAVLPRASNIVVCFHREPHLSKFSNLEPAFKGPKSFFTSDHPKFEFQVLFRCFRWLLQENSAFALQIRTVSRFSENLKIQAERRTERRSAGVRKKRRFEIFQTPLIVRSVQVAVCTPLGI